LIRKSPDRKGEGVLVGLQGETPKEHVAASRGGGEEGAKKNSIRGELQWRNFSGRT